VAQAIMSRASVCSGLPMLLLKKDEGFGMPYGTAAAASLCLLLLETSEVAKYINKITWSHNL